VHQQELWFDAISHRCSHTFHAALQRVDVAAIHDNAEIIRPDGGNVGLLLDGLLEDMGGLISAALSEQEGTTAPECEVQAVRFFAFVCGDTHFEQLLRARQIASLPGLFGLCNGVEWALPVYCKHEPLS
jgi:hypothetical protein